MLHKNRVWAICNIADQEDLANKLAYSSWTLCTGYRWNGYLLLNDSTSEGSLQEYAIVRESDGQQLDSVTFSWARSVEHAIEMIQRVVQSEPEYFYKVRPEQIVSAQKLDILPPLNMRQKEA